MSYCSVFTKNEKEELIKVLNENLELLVNLDNLEEVYDIVSKHYGKLIYKDFKKSKIKLRKLFEPNFVINIVLNYGLLWNDIPGSLIHFKTFKSPMLKQHKEKLRKLIFKKTKVLNNQRGKI